MDTQRQTAIYEALRHKGALAALKEFSEPEIREVAQRFGVHLPDRPLVPSPERAAQVRAAQIQIAEAYLDAQRQRSRAADAVERQKRAAKQAQREKRRARWTPERRTQLSDQEEDERYLQAVHAAIEALDRPRWAKNDAAHREELRGARVMETSAGSDARWVPSSLAVAIDDLLRPDTNFAASDVGHPEYGLAAYRKWLPRHLFNAYLDVLDLRLATFEEAEEAEVLHEPDDVDREDWRSTLVQLAVADEVPHLTACAREGRFV